MARLVRMCPRRKRMPRRLSPEAERFLRHIRFTTVLSLNRANRFKILGCGRRSRLMVESRHPPENQPELRGQG